MIEFVGDLMIMSLSWNTNVIIKFGSFDEKNIKIIPFQAFQVQAIDSVYIDLKDSEGLRKYSEQGEGVIFGLRLLIFDHEHLETYA